VRDGPCDKVHVGGLLVLILLFLFVLLGWLRRDLGWIGLGVFFYTYFTVWECGESRHF